MQYDSCEPQATELLGKHQQSGMSGATQSRHRTSLFVEGFLPGPRIAQEGTGSLRVWKSMSPTSLGEHRSSFFRPLSRRTSCFSSSMRRFRGGCTRRHT